MSSRTKLKKIELDHKGIEGILKSSGMEQAIKLAAERIKPSGEYEVQTEIARTRAAAWIQTASSEALADNMENNTLLKARSAGGRSK